MRLFLMGLGSDSGQSAWFGRIDQQGVDFVIEPLVVKAFRTAESAFVGESESFRNGPASRVAGGTPNLNLLQGMIAPPNFNKIADNGGHDSLAGESLSKPVAYGPNPIGPVD